MRAGGCGADSWLETLFSSAWSFAPRRGPVLAVAGGRCMHASLAASLLCCSGKVLRERGGSTYLTPDSSYS
jgi:hypothetical protein